MSWWKIYSTNGICRDTIETYNGLWCIDGHLKIVKTNGSIEKNIKVIEDNSNLPECLMSMQSANTLCPMVMTCNPNCLIAIDTFILIVVKK